MLQLSGACVLFQTAVFLSTAQGQLATIQESFHAPVHTETNMEDLGRVDENVAEASVVSEAGADDSIIA